MTMSPSTHGPSKKRAPSRPAEHRPPAHDHHHRRLPYEDPDYARPEEHPHEPPDNYRFPDRSIYGSYASKEPPRYVPHPYERSCFKPRKEDYKPPVTCDEPEDEGLCRRKDHRSLTADEQSRFLNAFNQINANGALGPLADIHAKRRPSDAREPAVLAVAPDLPDQDRATAHGG
jgi:hypothetical protein